MPDDDRQDQIPASQPATTALVPLAARIERRARRRWYRWAPDPHFVAHLIAQAQQVPQARTLRRASPADAQSAYRSHQAVTPAAGSRMRQVI
ncbi:MAG TPA: hypothetical protein VFL62_25295 [Bradyrhizobium sp.]|uniref:hypothetical protein n=1 Tax=Bradyrhizobium sp. TaxID=376 RepID=UPI002D803EF2|nr:hypothetical protein [Bradyrhizobium sp.]HET7889560.1 hypothetical protein [Bradyrhizobium sp.]